MNKIIFTFIYTMVVSSCLTTTAIARSRSIEYAANNTVLLVNYGEIQARSSNDKQDNLIKILIIVGLVSGVGTIGWFLSGYRVSDASAIPYDRPNARLIDRVSPKLRRQLLRLVNDPKTANRLLVGIQKHHSDRSPDWLAEKAIYDLTRGR